MTKNDETVTEEMVKAGAEALVSRVEVPLFITPEELAIEVWRAMDGLRHQIEQQQKHCEKIV